MIPFSLLGVGKFFGGNALTIQENKQTSTRLATVHCQTDCLFATLNRADYQELIALPEHRVQQHILQTL